MRRQRESPHIPPQEKPWRVPGIRNNHVSPSGSCIAPGYEILPPEEPFSFGWTPVIFQSKHECSVAVGHILSDDIFLCSGKVRDWRVHFTNAAITIVFQGCLFLLYHDIPINFHTVYSGQVMGCYTSDFSFGTGALNQVQLPSAFYSIILRVNTENFSLRARLVFLHSITFRSYDFVQNHARKPPSRKAMRNGISNPSMLTQLCAH
jgi:hypothetical protein